MKRTMMIGLLCVTMLGTHVMAQEGGGFVSYGDTVEGDLQTQNQWQFEGTSGDIISVGVNSTAFDATLELWDAQGNLLTTDLDSGKNNNPFIRDFMLPATQTYTIVVSAADGNSGEYSLTLTSSVNIGCEAYDQMVFEPVDLSSAPFMGRVGQFEEFTYRAPSHWMNGVWCTPLSRQKKWQIISGWISFLEIDVSGCLIIECLMQSSVVVEIELVRETSACFTG